MGNHRRRRRRPQVHLGTSFSPSERKKKKGKTSKHTNYNVGRYDISDGPVMPHNYDVYYSQLLYTRIMYLRNNTHYNTLYTYIQSSGV